MKQTTDHISCRVGFSSSSRPGIQRTCTAVSFYPHDSLGSRSVLQSEFELPWNDRTVFMYPARCSLPPCALTIIFRERFAAIESKYCLKKKWKMVILTKRVVYAQLVCIAGIHPRCCLPMRFLNLCHCASISQNNVATTTNPNRTPDSVRQ